jgi:hypothetical protein
MNHCFVRLAEGEMADGPDTDAQELFASILIGDVQKVFFFVCC